MVSLGGYRFEAKKNPFHKASRSQQFKFSARARWQDSEVIQYKGKSAKTRNYEIKVVVDSPEDRKIIPDLEKLAEEGKALEFISPSEGGFLGLWVITSLNITEEEFTIPGVALLQQGTISLKEFNE